MAQYTISIIIPVLNEATIIKSTLVKLPTNTDIEIIVVDGGSQDDTVIIAQQAGFTVMTVAGGGKAAQMNAGAKIAQGEIILFLHVDTQLPSNFANLVIKTLKQPKVVAGAFDLAIEGKDIALRGIELLVKLRSRLWSFPYGDQAIFIYKEIFEQLGGFAKIEIMEDFELIGRLKRQGKIAIAPAVVITSGRRWQKLGVWQTTVINQLIVIGYFAGISPNRLSRFYRHRGKNRKINIE